MMKMKSQTRRILVVEDEPSIVEVCRRVLRKVGYEVNVAANGQEGQLMIQRGDYDLCLLDIRTPKMNGMELYRWILGNRPNMAVKVVFTSGDLLTGETEQFLKDSGRYYLPKPFTPKDLRTIVQRALQDD